MAALEQDADKVEQYSHRPNLRFNGIPDTGETTENTTEKILQIINNDMCRDAHILPSQIERSHRLGSKLDRKGKLRYRPIIVRFGSEATRDVVYCARFMLKRRNKDGARKVFVNKDLPDKAAKESRYHF